MFNMRPLDDARTTQARKKIAAIYEEYDLAGAFMVINSEEAGYRYQLPTSWNAFLYDIATPMGLRIRAKSANMGHAQAHAALEGSAHILCQLSDFGAQTYKWCNDLLRMMQRQGIEIEHTPWGGESLGTIEEYPHG